MNIAPRIIAIIAVVALLLGFVALRSCQSASTAKTEARVSNSMAGAAVGTAIDGSRTAANVADQSAIDRKTAEDTQDEIRSANTAAAVTDAGRNGLHRLDHPR